MMLSLSMEIIPEGKAGLFDGMVSLGAASGAFLGPFLVTLFNYSYLPIFIITAVIFLVAFLALKILR
jgi:MFS family permease